VDDPDPFAAKNQMPTPGRPLLGLTLLVVEDSRFACEAVRLLCLRSGARIRRADCLKSARRHLRVYRPTVIIVDLGLPDGSGSDLIEELANTVPRVSVILGTSGDEFARETAIAAGADGFLPKPVSSLAVFQNEILTRLPKERQPVGPRIVPDETVEPDLIAFRDDMAHVAEVLGDHHNEDVLDYVAQFVGGVARSARDHTLADAAERLARTRAKGAPVATDTARIAGLVQQRLDLKKAI